MKGDIRLWRAVRKNAEW